MADLNPIKHKVTRPKKYASPQTKKFDKKYNAEFQKQSINPTVDLVETDGLLNEKEQSFKAKIWNLAKMESLVHGDDRLSVVYNKMAEDGEEKYGYHYNETIMNILFNEYILNNPRYIQKYKMAIPKEKKRRDKSGIEQLKQAAHLDTMTKQAAQKQPIKQQENDVVTHNNSLTGVQSDDMGDAMMDNNLYQGGESGTFDDREYLTHRIEKQYDTMEEPIVHEHHLGTREDKIDFILQHKGDIYKINRLQSAPDEQIDDIYNSIEQEMLGVDETTGAASSGAFAPPLGFKKQMGESEEVNEDVVDETTSSASSGQYTTKLGRDGGQGKRDPILDKPAWKGGEVIGESNYLTDPNGFKSFLKEMEESKLRNQGLRQSELREEGFDDSIVPSEQVSEYPLEPEQMNQPSMTQGLDLSKVSPVLMQSLHKAQQDLAAVNKKLGRVDNIERLMQHIQKFIGIGKLGEGAGDYDGNDVNESIIDDQPESMSNTNGMPKEESMAMKYNPATGGDGGGMFEGEINERPKIVDNNPLKDFGVSPPTGMGGHDKTDNAQHNAEPIEPKTMEKLTKENKEIEEDVTQRTKCNADEEPVLGKRVSEKGGCRKTGHAAEDATKNRYNVKATKERLSKYQKELDAKKGEYSKELDKNKKQMDKLKNKPEKSVKKKVVEDKKPSALIMKDRLGKENTANFNSDLKVSNTEMLKVAQDELSAQEQIEQVPTNPYELGQKIEKQHLATNDGLSFKNVGDSTNDQGDEIPKRNLTSDEEELLNLYRKGQHSWNYDSEPSKRFVERMKKDMGEEIFELMKKQMEFIAGAPMYNKDPQPTQDTTVDKAQFDKYKTGWNEKRGLKMEGVVSGKYKNEFGKNKFVNFDVAKSELVENVEGLIPINLDGMGNRYTTRVEENTDMRSMMDAFKFYMNNEGKIKHVKKGKQNLNEAENAEKPINEEYQKMMKLASYDPSKHTDTKNVKKNRGF